MLSRLRLPPTHLSRHWHFPSSTTTNRALNATMSTFNLTNLQPPVPVTLTSDISQQSLLAFPAFKTWLSTLQHSLSQQSQSAHPFHAAPYRLRTISVQAVDWFGPKRDKLGFVKLTAEVTNDDGAYLPGSVFLRGGSVAMLLVLQPDDVDARSEQDKHVILTVQPRIPAGSLAFAEIPAGMLEGGTLKGAAAKEIEEETGLRITEDELLDMTQLALDGVVAQQAEGEELQQAMYPSPGGSDEYIPVFLAQKRVKREELDGWRGKLTGLRDHGEKITLSLCRLEELWKVGARDGKTLAAWALYSGLKQEGKL